MDAELIALRATRSHGSDARVMQQGACSTTDAAAATGANVAAGAVHPSRSNSRNGETVLASAVDQSPNCSWEIKTAVSGMNGEVAEVVDAAEANGVRNLEEILKEDAFCLCNQGTCVKVNRWLYSVLTRYTSSEASRLHANQSRKTFEVIFRAQRNACVRNQQQT